ncbi:hypothetical protein LF1_58040 [Rubripirellula obstinata]|uniref:Uncharacterized protein n=1 Tax=Rubripirellula obstinata TaxID=406547 RepID=A0A5B1C8Q1_9BACT|nr:hypothetical protein LF1_58040 [Rubripirellula obstinata]
MPSVSADFVHLGDNHQVQNRSKVSLVKQVSASSSKSSVQGQALVVPRSASGTSALIEHWNSGVG